MLSSTAGVVILTVGVHMQGVMEAEATRTCEGGVEATRDVSCRALAPRLWFLILVPLIQTLLFFL